MNEGEFGMVFCSNNQFTEICRSVKIRNEQLTERLLKIEKIASVRIVNWLLENRDSKTEGRSSTEQKNSRSDVAASNLGDCPPDVVASKRRRMNVEKNIQDNPDIRSFLLRHGSNFKKVDGDGDNLLHLAAQTTSSVELIKFLLDKGIPIGSVNKNGDMLTD